MVFEFTGSQTEKWILLMEDYFRDYRVPEERKVLRAKENVSGDVRLNWFNQQRAHGSTWEGFKVFLRTCYADTSIHEARQKLRLVEWKGSVDQLRRDIQDAAGSCFELTEEELINAVVQKVPEALRTMWAARRREFTTWEEAAAFLEDAADDFEEVERARCNRNRDASPHNVASALDRERRELRSDKALAPREGSRRHDRVRNKAPKDPWTLPKNLSACRNCGGMGHLSQTCANIRGSRSQPNARCFQCQGRGHMTQECTNPLFEQSHCDKQSKGCPTPCPKRPRKPRDRTSSTPRARLTDQWGRSAYASRGRDAHSLGGYDEGETWVTSGGLIGDLRKQPLMETAEGPQDEPTRDAAPQQARPQESTLATLVGIPPPMLGIQTSATRSNKLALDCTKPVTTHTGHPANQTDTHASITMQTAISTTV
ncbi:hypothetical protein Emed_000889 [Eimeria media]